MATSAGSGGHFRSHGIEKSRVRLRLVAVDRARGERAVEVYLEVSYKPPVPLISEPICAECTDLGIVIDIADSGCSVWSPLPLLSSFVRLISPQRCFKKIGSGRERTIWEIRGI